MKLHGKSTVWLMVLISLFVFTFYQAEAQRVQSSGRGKARIGGIVTDQENNPIANAEITAVFQDEITTFEAKTNKKGKWGMIGLGTGKFKFTIKAEGFAPTIVTMDISQLNRNEDMLTKLQVTQTEVVQEDMTKLLEEGNVLFNQKKYDEAIAAYQKILDAKPEFYQVNYKIAICHKMKEDYDQALKVFEGIVTAAKEKDDKDIAGKALGEIGGIYLKKNDLEKSQSYFKQSIDVNPADEILAYNVGEINFNNNDVDAAIRYFEIAAKIKPDWSEPYLKMAYCYLNKNDNTQAIANLKKVIELEPNSEKGQIAQGILESLQ
jgi:Tfp pilus assembly protein PilF